jgi:hypothetical protein
MWKRGPRTPVLLSIWNVRPFIARQLGLISVLIVGMPYTFDRDMKEQSKTA